MCTAAGTASMCTAAGTASVCTAAGTASMCTAAGTVSVCTAVGTASMVGFKKVNICNCNYTVTTNYCMLQSSVITIVS